MSRKLSFVHYYDKMIVGLKTEHIMNVLLRGK